MDFNPRSHERSDPPSSLPRSYPFYFNPRSHERSDPRQMLCSKSPELFQSTLPREERLILWLVTSSTIYFNPRSHERSDTLLPLNILPIAISIHAPTRGATYKLGIVPHDWKFQSTLPREERPLVILEQWFLSHYFNPRSHERSDSIQRKKASKKGISIHAPTRGATIKAEEIEQKRKISIHAPTRGATKRSIRRSKVYQISIHAPTRGATLHSYRFLPHSRFQSTLPREERHQHCLYYHSLYCYFNPRSHERSDSNIAQKICLFLYNTDNKYIIR